MAPPKRKAKVNILHGPILDPHVVQAIREITKHLQLITDNHVTLTEQHDALVASVAGLGIQQSSLASVVARNAAVVQQTAPASSGGTPSDTTPDDGGAGAAGCSAAGADGHVAPGTELTLETAGIIVCGTGNEWPLLKAVVADQPTRDANTAELLGRMIWHLQLAGFTAGKQQNPSGAISGDKLTVQVSGVWWAYDVMSLTTFDLPVTTHMLPVGSPQTVADSGVPD